MVSSAFFALPLRSLREKIPKGILLFPRSTFTLVVTGKVVRFAGEM
jgi:hypothetical protein